MRNRNKSISAIIALAFIGAVLIAPAMADEHLPEAITVPQVPLQTAYAEDFAEGDGGYTGTGSWQFGSPSGAPDIPEGKNTNIWGTNLAGDYGNSECSALQSAPIDLSTGTPGTTAELAFKHFTDIEPRYDGAAVFVSDDGVQWEYVVPNEGYDDTMFFSAYSCLGITFEDEGYTGRVGEWRTSTIDVTDYLGGDLHIRWVFGSDFSVTDLGFYVDQVTVQISAGGQSVPLPPLPDPNDQLPERVNVPAVPWQTHYAEDFAEGDGGYTGTGSWQFGSPSSAPEIPEGKNTNIWGTNLAGNYGNSECSTLQSAPIDLSGTLPVESLMLSFKHYTDIEPFWDGATVFVSSDGSNWQYVVPNEGYDDSLNSFTSTRSCLGEEASAGVFTGRVEEWRTSTFDVSEFAGGDLHIQWVFGSDSSITDLGFYVDQVAVQSTLGGQNVDVPDLPGPGDLLPGQVTIPSVPLQTAYAEDFAEGDGGYTGTGSWQFGSPSGAPEIPEGKNTNIWGTNLAGNYGNSECSTLQSPPVDLSGALPGSTAQLSFKHYTDIEPFWDGATVFVSSDGTNWQYVVPNEGYDGTMSSSPYTCMGLTFQDEGFTGRVEQWRTSTFDVSDFAGGDLHIRWIFGSDFSVTDLGFYVDQVTVQLSAGGQTIDLPEV